VFVGDAEQLEPIPAGAAFRAIAKGVGYHELTGNRRGMEPDNLIERFERMRRDFIKIAGRVELDPAPKARVAKLRQEMKRAAKDISSSADLMREAARAGIAGQVKSLARENARGRSEEQGFEMER
jgi:hypothetical protein